MAFPFLPWNSLNSNLRKTKYHKSHHFDYKNEVSMLVGEEKPGIGGELLRGQKVKAKNTVFPKGYGTNLPAWIAFDRQVLCFDAFFQEAVHAKREEQFRIRHCKVYFYLEDDSIQVIEPREKNSGVPQATLLRRHRIPKPAPHDDEYYTAEDFNIGNEINLYSKVFKITDSDDFTKNFLRKMGVRVNHPPDNAPDNPYTKYRKAMEKSMHPLSPYEKHDTLKQFLDHDRHVLRFYCSWDDTDSMFGDPRELILHYFLADDTIEIREVIPANSGRDAAPMFLRRGKLPKNIESLRQPGEITDRTVLNVFGPTGHGGRYILDSLKTGAVKTDFYRDSDLTLGSVLNVWGRKVLLSDCDEFTKEYYRTKYGMVMISPALGSNTTDIPGDWTNPCGGTISSVQQVIQATIPLLSHEEGINRIGIKLREALEESESLQNLYATERIRSVRLLMVLDKFHLDGFPSVKISTEEKDAMKRNLTETHKYVFMALSKVAVFLEAVATDEEVFEYKSYSSHIEENKRKLFTTLCEIDVLIRNLGSKIENHVLRDVMKDEYRSISDTSNRHMRDYVIVKDTSLLYSTLIELYTELRDVLESGNSSNDSSAA